MIRNLTKNRIIVKNKKICKTVFSKALGLMFSRQLKDKGLIFVFDKKQRVSLHMFFVFYPIDLIILNSNKKIIEIKRNFKPFSFYTTKTKAKYIIELPLDTNSKIGDNLSF